VSQNTRVKHLMRVIEELLDHQADDLRLRDHLEGLRRDPDLPGLTWFWGPELYRRNRVVFREFILAHLSDIERNPFPGWRRVKWSEHNDRLQPWLDLARRNRDVWLTRRLLRWKFAGEGWSLDHAAWCRELVHEYQSAPGPAAQGVVLDEFDAWFQLDEPTALALYSANPASSSFLLRHLPLRFSFWGAEKRQMWRRLYEAALDKKDSELAFTLYRRQVDLSEWQRDIEKLADEIANPTKLCDELRKRHPEGWALKLGEGVLSLLRRRGRDVMPYVREKLESVVGGWNASPPEPFIEMGREEEWWDLWAATVRSVGIPKYFNKEMQRLLDDPDIDDPARVERLKALAGVSREWNWAGIGLARVHMLEDDVAAGLYRRYPQLVHGPFKPNVVPTWWQGTPKLLDAARKAGDAELVDLLASRYATRAGFDGLFYAKQQKALLETAEELASSYQDLRDRDAIGFARRAANILTQVPAYAIHNYDRLMRTNSLARLLFVRSFEAYLALPEAVGDLVEASEVHVQMLAYHVLAHDDDRARKLAVEFLDILLGTLLRPLHRKTRLAAFGALANAARGSPDAAARVHRRARQALRLPDTKYPKEQLVGLIGMVMHRRPELCGPRERITVYALPEAAP
jgi:hypothetical protein